MMDMKDWSEKGADVELAIVGSKATAFFQQ